MDCVRHEPELGEVIREPSKDDASTNSRDATIIHPSDQRPEQCEDKIPGILRSTAAQREFCIIGVLATYTNDYYNASEDRCIDGCRTVSNREAFQVQEEIVIRYEGSTRCFID